MAVREKHLLQEKQKETSNHTTKFTGIYKNMFLKIKLLQSPFEEFVLTFPLLCIYAVL